MQIVTSSSSLSFLDLFFPPTVGLHTFYFQHLFFSSLPIITSHPASPDRPGGNLTTSEGSHNSKSGCYWQTTAPESLFIVLKQKNKTYSSSLNHLHTQGYNQRRQWSVWLVHYLIHVRHVGSQVFSAVEETVRPFHLNSFPNFRRTQVQTVSALKM